MQVPKKIIDLINESGSSIIGDDESIPPSTLLNPKAHKQLESSPISP